MPGQHLVFLVGNIRKYQRLNSRVHLINETSIYYLCLFIILIFEYTPINTPIFWMLPVISPHIDRTPPENKNS
jgi:hypothetical protein